MWQVKIGTKASFILSYFWYWLSTIAVTVFLVIVCYIIVILLSTWWKISINVFNKLEKKIQSVNSSLKIVFHIYKVAEK